MYLKSNASKFTFLSSFGMMVYDYSCSKAYDFELIIRKRFAKLLSADVCSHVFKC